MLKPRLLILGLLAIASCPPGMSRVSHNLHDAVTVSRFGLAIEGILELPTW